MNNYLISKLKEGRLNKGLKQSDVTNLIGIKNTTLSNYENGITEPDIDTFLQLCELYELDYAAILGEAYGLSVQGSDFDIKPSEIEHIKKYRALDEHGKKMVDFTLLEEYDRSINVKDPAKAIPIHTKSDYTALNAAHEYEGATNEEKEFSDAVMYDDKEWE